MNDKIRQGVERVIGHEAVDQIGDQPEGVESVEMIE